MNETLRAIIFRLTGLPHSAVVAHAWLEHDLGIDHIRMQLLMQRLDIAFGIQTHEPVWCVFQRVGDINDYVVKQLKSKELTLLSKLEY